MYSSEIIYGRVLGYRLTVCEIATWEAPIAGESRALAGISTPNVSVGSLRFGFIFVPSFLSGFFSSSLPPPTSTKNLNQNRRTKTHVSRPVQLATTDPKTLTMGAQSTGDLASRRRRRR